MAGNRDSRLPRHRHVVNLPFCSIFPLYFFRFCFYLISSQMRFPPPCAFHVVVCPVTCVPPPPLSKMSLRLSRGQGCLFPEFSQNSRPDKPCLNLFFSPCFVPRIPHFHVFSPIIPPIPRLRERIDWISTAGPPNPSSRVCCSFPHLILAGPLPGASTRPVRVLPLTVVQVWNVTLSPFPFFFLWFFSIEHEPDFGSSLRCRRSPKPTPERPPQGSFSFQTYFLLLFVLSSRMVGHDPLPLSLEAPHGRPA